MTAFIEPEIVRTSILGGDTQLDAGLPLGVPIAALMPDLLVALRIPDSFGATDRVATPPWTLARIDGTRLRPSDTLADAGVVHGELLLVRPDHPVARRTVVDDVADGVASALRRTRPAWSPSAAVRTGCAVFLAAAVTAFVLAGWATDRGDAAAVGAITAAATALLMTVAALGRRFAATTEVIATQVIATEVIATVSLAATSFAASTAWAVTSDGPADARTAVAATAALVVAVIGHRLTGVATAAHVAVATACALLAVGAAASTIVSLAPERIAACLAAVAVATVLLAPRLAVAAARLPLPAVPTAAPPPPDELDDPVPGVDALALRDPAAARTDDDPMEAIAGLVFDDDLTRRAGAASSILTGLLAGGVAIVAAATVAVAATAGPSTVAAVYCAAIIVSVLARGRTHVDRRQSAVLVGGAAMTAVATLAAWTVGGGVSPFTAFVAVLGFGTVALLIGVIAPGGEYSPLQVRAAEVAEYGVLVAVLPLLVWVLDLYRTVRGA
ncbi:type VII secretion integral membrane protein EccD [Gordonia shandongensis]|uniref:type VII secretion integral membrane protein EccD n=1 Tax=Gordonia shandongensis TaxID=376351 RepID=UPI000417DF1A|nr:type VII secretion integral membrane protein EccD [Gordonia shandongensis]